MSALRSALALALGGLALAGHEPERDVPPRSNRSEDVFDKRVDNVFVDNLRARSTNVLAASSPIAAPPEEWRRRKGSPEDIVGVPSCYKLGIYSLTKVSHPNDRLGFGQPLKGRDPVYRRGHYPCKRREHSRLHRHKSYICAPSQDPP